MLFGILVSFFNLDSEDWKLEINPNAISIDGISLEASTKAKSWKASKDGVISLEHDLCQLTIDRVPGLIESVLNQGMLIKPVGLCVGDYDSYQPVRNDNETATPTQNFETVTETSQGSKTLQSTLYSPYAKKEIGMGFKAAINILLVTILIII